MPQPEDPCREFTVRALHRLTGASISWRHTRATKLKALTGMPEGQLSLEGAAIRAVAACLQAFERDDWVARVLQTYVLMPSVLPIGQGVYRPTVEPELGKSSCFCDVFSRLLVDRTFAGSIDHIELNLTVPRARVRLKAGGRDILFVAVGDHVELGPPRFMIIKSADLEVLHDVYAMYRQPAGQA